MRIFEKIFPPQLYFTFFFLGTYVVGFFFFFFSCVSVIEIIHKHEYLINTVIDKPSKIIWDGF